jgi:hypothetical protein
LASKIRPLGQGGVVGGRAEPTDKVDNFGGAAAGGADVADPLGSEFFAAPACQRTPMRTVSGPGPGRMVMSAMRVRNSRLRSRSVVGADHNVPTVVTAVGAALLPGAWPILRRALGPVLGHLKERLGGREVTSSKEVARKAADAFEADQHLQEVVRSALVAQLDDLIRRQKDIDADVQKLMIIASDNQETLAEILGGLKRIDYYLAGGVNLSDEAVAKLAEG